MGKGKLHEEPDSQQHHGRHLNRGNKNKDKYEGLDPCKGIQ
jgi:hypothetical protein